MLLKIVSKLKSKKVLLKILSSSFLSLPVTLAVSFVTFRVIDPYYMGIWAAMSIVETYATVLRLGVINGMNRELPFAMGSGKFDDAKKYAETTLAYTLVAILVIFALVPFIITNIEVDFYYFASIVVTVIRVALTYYSSYLAATFRSSENFNKFSNIQFIMLGAKVLFAPLIFYFGYLGYLVMNVILIFINTSLLHYFRPIKVKPRFNKSIFYSLVKTGFPIFLGSYAVILIATIPRLFILKFGNETLLGIYSPVLMFITTFSMLPQTLSSYYYPKLSYLLGKENNVRLILKIVSRIFIISIAIISPLIVLGYFILDDFISYFPKYKDSLPYLKIGIFIGPFILAKLGNLISIVLKKVKYLTYHVLLYALFQIAYILIFYSYVSKDVLYCAIWSQVLTFISLFFASLLLNYLAVKEFTYSKFKLVGN